MPVFLILANLVSLVAEFQEQALTAVELHPVVYLDVPKRPGPVQIIDCLDAFADLLFDFLVAVRLLEEVDEFIA